MTTVYIIRHSKPLKELCGEMKTKDSLQLINEKHPLCVVGEKYAEKVSNNKEFENIDAVWSSNYVRAMSTAKYFAEKNNIKVNVDDRFGERIQGIISWDELPNNYAEKQFKDEDYRWRDGECQKEVVKRMRAGLFDLLKNNSGKRIVVVSHNTAMTFLLKSLCQMTMSELGKKIVFNDEVVYVGNFDFCETFKLEFDNDLTMKSIRHINTKP